MIRGAAALRAEDPDDLVGYLVLTPGPDGHYDVAPEVAALADRGLIRILDLALRDLLVDPAAQLRCLADLVEDGFISREEYDEAKARVLRPLL